MLTDARDGAKGGTRLTVRTRGAERHDRPSESLDQASRNRNRPCRLAPEGQLRFRRLDPTFGEWGVATPLLRRCEDEPSLREIARDHGAEHAHLSSIKCFPR